MGCPYGKERSEEKWVCRGCEYRYHELCEEEARYEMKPTAEQKEFESRLDDLLARGKVLLARRGVSV